MTKNSAKKKAARAYQAANPGTTFPAALQAVDHREYPAPGEPVILDELWHVKDPGRWQPLGASTDLANRFGELARLGRSRISGDEFRLAVDRDHLQHTVADVEPQDLSDRQEGVRRVTDVVTEDEFRELLDRLAGRAREAGLPFFGLDESQQILGERRWAAYLRTAATSVGMTDLAARLDPEAFPASAADRFISRVMVDPSTIRW